MPFRYRLGVSELNSQLTDALRAGPGKPVACKRMPERVIRWGNLR